MNLALELPEDVGRELAEAWPDIRRRALEAVALEGYRSGALTRGQVSRMLELSFWDTEAFLKAHQAYLPYMKPLFSRTGPIWTKLCLNDWPFSELSDQAAPETVKSWIGRMPPWIAAQKSHPREGISLYSMPAR